MKHPVWKKISFVLSLLNTLISLFFCVLTFDNMLQVRTHYTQHIIDGCNFCFVGLSVFAAMVGGACAGGFSISGILLAIYGRHAWDGKVKKVVYPIIAVLAISFLAALVAAIIAYGMQK